VCTAAGGLKDVCEAAGPGSIFLAKHAVPEQIAVAFEELAKNPDRLRLMRAAAWERKEYFSWERTVMELQRIWKYRSRIQSKPSNSTTRSKSMTERDA